MLKYLKKYWFYCLLAPLFMLGELAMDLFQPDMMATIVDDGVLSGNLNVIITQGIYMVLLVIFGGTCGVLCGVFANIAAQQFGNDIRKDLFAHIMDFSFEQTDHFTTGSLVTRITNDVTQVEQMVMMSVRSLVRCVVMFVGGIIMLYRQSPRFAAVAVCALPFVTVIVVVTLKKVSPLYTVIQKKLDRVNSIMQENIAGARVVKAYVKEDDELKNFSGANDSLCDTNLRAQTILAFMSPLVNIILNVCVVGVLYVGGYTVQHNGSITPGQTMAALTYLSLILMRIVFFANIFQTFTRASASWKRIKEVLDTECAQKVRTTIPMGEKNDTANVRTDRTPAEIETGNGRGKDAVDSEEGHGKEKSPADAGTKDRTDRTVVEIGTKTGNESLGIKDGKKGEIEFRNVNFAFPDAPENPVLKDISFTVKRGETVAIIGSTGCGKSSLVQLIPRFYDVTGGAVLVDGVDVRDYSMQALRDKVGIVQQKTELFSRSIRENILWGSEEAGLSMEKSQEERPSTGKETKEQDSAEKPSKEPNSTGKPSKEANSAEKSSKEQNSPEKSTKNQNLTEVLIEEKVRRAARIAQAEDFILRTPDGYDTQVTEGGHSLSGGQKQRISIARAVMREPEILIFDDSGSALDLKTEAALYAALYKDFADTTRIIVAQRIFSVKQADRILVLDGGEIVARGTHEELLATSPVYQEICRSQLKKGEVVVDD
ncbi:MAG: ABC transporter ATP-binding protein/permease [Lachnospiraceae bacterium]|nr:ABC transporter ATP-binding protein/permease [Lachnospiraceae bacterium]